MFVRLCSVKTVRLVVAASCATLGGMALLCRPQAVATGISHGLSVCGTVIIPTLLPFLVLSGFLSRSGIAAAIGRLAERPTRLLFGLPGCAAVGLLIGFIGGYPAGSTVVGELVRTHQLSQKDGQRMLRICVCGGPGFIINTVGLRILHNRPFGIALFAASLFSAMLIGILSAPRNSRIAVPSSPTIIRPSVLSAFTESVAVACRSLLTTCGFLVLFSAVLAVMDSVLPGNRLLSAVLACLLEVSCGCLSAANLHAAPLLIGFAVGFGGLSVHCQIAASLADTRLVTPSFWLTRTAHGALTALSVVLFCRMFAVTMPVFDSGSSPLITAFSGGVSTSVFLLVLCGIWLLSVDKGRGVTYNKAKV